MKKFLALVLIGSMLVCMPVMAAPSPSASDYAPTTPAPKKTNTATANTVSSVPGHPELTETAQVGDILVDGEVSDIRIEITKPDEADIALGASLAATIPGSKLISCVGVKSQAQSLGNALAVFKLKGVKENSKILCYALVDGEWVIVPVPIVINDFVVINLEKPGKLMFMEKTDEVPAAPEAPAAPAAAPVA